MNFSDRMGVKILGVTAIIASFAFALVSREAALSASAGGILSLANFRLASRNLSKVLDPGIDPAFGKGLAVASYMFRLTLLGAVVYFALVSGIMPVYFLLGLSAPVVSSFLSYGELRRVA